MIKYPIGISDFQKIRREGYWFADKSLFIQEVLDGGEIQLITRPRRFGKTMNLIMLQSFLQSSPVERLTWFEGLAIADTPLMQRHASSVIFLSLKDLKEETFTGFETTLRLTLSDLYSQFSFLAADLSAVDRQFFDQVVNQTMDMILLKNALSKLITWLAQHYGQKVYLLIDEYDTPIHEAWAAGYYDKAVAFMRGFLGRALKDHRDLEKGVLTGILRLAKESIFSDLNNLQVHTIISGRFTDKFGFTEKDVEQLLAAAKKQEEEDVIRRWYNGYSICGKTLYNPWSLLYYLDAPESGPQPYWVNTSANSLIHELLVKSNDSVHEKLVCLLADECIETTIVENATFYNLTENENLLWSFLLYSGYLTVANVNRGSLMPIYHLKIPNLEVGFVYRQAFFLWQEKELGARDVVLLQNALIEGNDPLLSEKLNQLARRVISFYDTGGKEPERFYHAFMLGILAGLIDRYEIRSNREAGYGRYDCIMRPRNDRDPGIVLEFKTFAGDDPQPAIDQALKQIQTQGYGADFEDQGLKQWREVAIAFNGKKVLAQSRVRAGE